MFRNRLLPLLFSLAATALIAGTLAASSQLINATVAALLFLLWAGLATALWGLAPGILAAVAAFLAFNFFFIAPLYTLAVHKTEDLLVLVVFLIASVAINQLVGQIRNSLAAATAREHEATRLFEMSHSLSRIQDEGSVAQSLAAQLQTTFSAYRVEIFLEPVGERTALLFSTAGGGARSVENFARPPLLLPLQAARGLLGEARLWRDHPPFDASDIRFAQILASQGALALERARLLQAETRARALEDSDRLKTALLSSVSHDLRTPLATIKAAVSSLRSGEVVWESEARADLLAAIEEDTDQLNQLVGNLLDMSRIEAGALNPNRKWNSVAEIVSGVLTRLRTQNHKIILNIPEASPLVAVDYLLMEQVFANLLSNSLKYSPEGSAIRVSAQTRDDRTLLVQIQNQSPPVAEEHLERIFDKFHRVTAAERITGAGLGLSICKGIVEAHGGKIWAENRADGFAFNFTLPLILEGASPRVPSE